MTEKVGWLSGALSRIREFAHERSQHPLARKRPKIGLALGGGFARGISHIGVLRVLEQNKIPIDILSGTSVGALIASTYAAGTSLAEMERQASQTHFTDFGRWTLSWLGLASNKRLEDYLHRFSTAETFEQLKKPLSITATDLGTGEAVYFHEGELGPPLRASCAYPGLFTPVEFQGRVLVDGFLASPVPVDAARQLGADYVIAVYLESSPPDEKP
ncbi:MAG: patatin-like phospholipase family protein, partial [Acidobacteria bacterium]|nr:patatin-like phospholipase family protein [Acidobacteriota bacterium]